MSLDRFVAGLLLLFLLPACSDRPSWVLTDAKMADVLYDLNLAEAEIENNYLIFQNDSGNRKELLNSVFRKHKITEQQFDTSLVWYNAHLDQFLKITDQVSKRYSDLSEKLQKQLDEETRLATEQGRVNIWRGPCSYVLLPASRLQNTISFELDSISWERGDRLELSFEVLGCRPNTKSEVLFYTACADTTILTRSYIEKNGLFHLNSMPQGMKDVKRIYGSIHLPESVLEAEIVVYNFAIFQRKE